MKIFKKIAVRVIPVGILTFIIIAAIAYQRGVFDLTFIERPSDETSADTSDTYPATEPIGTDTTAPPPDTSDVTGEDTEAPTAADPVLELRKRFDSTSSLSSRGWNVTDAEYASGMRLTLLNPAVSLSKSYSLRMKDGRLVTRIPDEYSGYTTVESTIRVERPLVEVYMDYIIVDNGSTVTVLNNQGNILYSGFDIEKYVPAYTRDSEDNAQFAATVQSKTNKKETVTEYYMFDKDGNFVKSDYDDAAENRGLYINYPSYFGKSDNNYVRMYQNGLYGYAYVNGGPARGCIYPEAFNFSEGLAAVVDQSGLLTYVQKWFSPQFITTRNYYNDSHWYVTSSYRAPDSRGIESLGFFYFEHGLCRVRKVEVDYNYTDRVVSDNELLIRIDNTLFPVPSGYTVTAYSCGVILLEKDGLYGFMDYTGKWIAQPIYDYAEPFSEGLGVIGKDGKVGLIDSEGNFVLPMVFDRVQSCSGGIIAAWDQVNGWTLFNKMARSAN